ncbi:Phosphoglycerol transferase MdoB [Marisediminitalea aggregata]|uniref:Phosphoglycerol transferase MdoB n=1 Tax=Marisediminitalea aggregata TaxID=634436 RepID=A0A1M5GPH2_9ALTE|nr:sulfatase-like hydrolase/transferase [Marisediminitalea aggregata]SHG05639.1 Phosphoglycerol transferase MdoB [Marisediminitalea aggregata]
MLQPFAFAFTTLLISLCLLRAVKALRGQRGALTQQICLDDLVCLLLPSAIVLFTHVVNWPVLTLISVFAMGLYGVLVWLDAVLFVQYRIEINRQTLAWFFTGSRGLAKGLPHLLALFSRFPVTLLIPVIWCMAIASLIVPPLPLNVLVVCVLLTAVCLWRIQAGIAEVGVLLILMVMVMNWSPDVPVVALDIAGSMFLGVVALIGLMLLMRKLFVSQHEFLTAPTLLANIVASDEFDAPQGFAARIEHQKFVSADTPPKEKSRYFGHCKQANIILVTMESLGCYINPYINPNSGQGAHSRLAERLAGNSWLSKQHFSLCPNTTVSTNQMYTGFYSNNPYNKADSLFPGKSPQHINHLQKHGYKALFVDSADTGLYDYHRLLSRIGFDRVWGTKDIPANGLQADYRLWNMVDVIAEEVADTPFFLHVINDQTHMPYEIVDSARFNRHRGNSQKAKYLNAVEEVDYILDEFLRRLGEKLDLSNTIVVFTGDHGESFGEFGYSFHSNSVILPQIHVPFMLSHPNLPAKTLEHSSHFDLFPTFFDLLGIDYSHDCLGNPLGLDDREFAYFAHSATLKGNSPANFGFIRDGELLWMDRLFNQVSLLGSDQTRKTLDTKEQAYAKALLYQMLSARGVIHA